jgi:hypothetical protein
MKNNDQHNLVIPAMILSIIGSVIAVITIGLCTWGAIYLFNNKDYVINISFEDLIKDSAIDPNEADLIAKTVWSIIFWAICCYGVISGVYALVVDLVTLAYVKRALTVHKYSLALGILQIFAFPLGTISGILMIVARSKATNKQKTKD